MTIRNCALGFIVALLTAVPAAVQAGETSAIINGKSFHIGASEDWNENNMGFGIEHRFTSRSRWRPVVMVNGFRDSSDNMSYMAGAGLHRNLYATERLGDLYIDVGINAFLMTREDVNGNRPFPGALPSLTIGNRHMGLNLTYLPRFAVEKIYDAHMSDASIEGIVFMQFKVNVAKLLP